MAPRMMSDNAQTFVKLLNSKGSATSQLGLEVSNTTCQTPKSWIFTLGPVKVKPFWIIRQGRLAHVDHEDGSELRHADSKIESGRNKEPHPKTDMNKQWIQCYTESNANHDQKTIRQPGRNFWCL